MTRPFFSVLALTALFFIGADLHAQEAPPQDLEHELRTMVTEPTPADRDRQALRDLLDRAEVNDAVTSLGLDPERLEAGVSTLGEDEAADLARQVETLEDEADLVGGDTVVISATTLIIILLIILIVA